jgi:hypothetical protein
VAGQPLGLVLSFKLAVLNGVAFYPSCGDTMKHFLTIPKLGARLEQFMFACPSCEQVKTNEVRRAV